MQVNTKKGEAAKIKLNKRERDALGYAAELLSQLGRMADDITLAEKARNAAKDVDYVASMVG